MKFVSRLHPKASNGGFGEKIFFFRGELRIESKVKEEKLAAVYSV